MPTYYNANQVAAQTADLPLLILPGQSVEINHYVKDLPAGVSLISHLPQISPWVLLATINATPSNVIDVAGYNNIIVYNGSDEVIDLAANTDTANALVIMANTQITFSSERLLGSLSVLSKPGVGTVQIWGVE